MIIGTYLVGVVFFEKIWHLSEELQTATLFLSDEQATSINLPSSVFASEFEEEVGLLNKAAPVSGELLICLKRYRRTDFIWSTLKG